MGKNMRATISAQVKQGVKAAFKKHESGAADSSSESEWKTCITAESSRNLFVISHKRKLSNSLFVENKENANLSSTTVATVVPKHLKSAKLVKQFKKISKKLLKVLIDSGSDESFLNQKQVKHGKIKSLKNL